MVLNLRSRLCNYHATVNALILWNNRAPKRLVQTFNHLGICSSHTFQGRAVGQLGQDVVKVAQEVAQDPDKLKLLPYDNFNWMSRAWEVSATHGSIQHDQVSAMLVVLRQYEGHEQTNALRLADVQRFDEKAGTRHRLPPRQALEDILPNAEDQATFREHVTLHVAAILSEGIASFAKFRSKLPKFTDPKAIPPHKTEKYYLPTFDQEQSSTRGNMIVLRHYFLDVLKIPKPVFEAIMYFVLGDRLTTARDRAAQNQRAVDRSESRFDHLKSLAVTSGVMHICMNKMQNFSRNSWGTANAKDDVSLLTLRDLLPNRSNVNLHKHDFYAWLRFLDVVLRALVITAAMVVLDVTSTSALPSLNLSEDEFHSLCKNIVDRNFTPSIDALEADGIKTLAGETVCGHAALMLFDLMTLREMRDAIKHGHPTRMHHMMKFWTPMFYAGRGYNYAHELMELLHNRHHDWPEDSADVLFAGMLVNNTGKPDGFLEADLDVEHLNERIKGRTDEPNITPDTLAKITPAIGHVRHLADQLCEDLGVEELNQHHAHVRQEKDVGILVEHMNRKDVLRFDQDKHSEHKVAGLYTSGLYGLGGTSGGHARHLARHKLTLRSRHGINTDTYQNTAAESALLNDPEEDEIGHVEFILGGNELDNLNDDGTEDRD